MLFIVLLRNSIGEDNMCAQKTAPKSTPVERMRNDAIDWLAVQIARPKSQVENPRLRRHVQGPLGSTSEIALRSFLKRPEGGEFYLSFSSMAELEKFDRLLEKSGLFKNIECVFSKVRDPDTRKIELEVTVTLENRELGLADAKKLLEPKEEKLLGIAREEEAKRTEFRKGGMEEDVLLEMAEKGLSLDPLHGATPVKMEMEGEPAEKIKTPKKERELGFRGWYLSSSSGKKVPIFSKNWDKNEEERKRLWGELVESGKCTFKVNSRILRKFESERFREQFLGLLRNQGISDPRITIKGNSITIRRVVGSEAAAKEEYERILEGIKKGSRGEV